MNDNNNEIINNETNTTEPTSVTPIVPTEPVAPVTPVPPVVPTEPVAPVAPAAPVAPVAPDAPIAPEAPVAPVTPTVPSEPVVAPVAPSLEAVETEPKKKGVSKILFIVLIILIILGGGAYVGSIVYDNMKTKKTNGSTTSTTTTTTTAAAVKGDTIEQSVMDNAPKSIDAFKANIAGKISEYNLVLLDNSFTKIDILDPGECTTDGQVISKSYAGHDYQVVCSVNNDSPDFKSYSGTVDGFDVAATITGGYPQYYTNGTYLVFFFPGDAEDGGQLQVYTKNGVGSVIYPSATGNTIAHNLGDYEGIVPYIKNNVLYFVEADSSSDTIVVVDLSKDFPLVGNAATFVR